MHLRGLSTGFRNLKTRDRACIKAAVLSGTILTRLVLPAYIISSRLINNPQQPGDRGITTRDALLYMFLGLLR